MGEQPWIRPAHMTECLDRLAVAERYLAQALKIAAAKDAEIAALKGENERLRAALQEIYGVTSPQMDAWIRGVLGRNLTTAWTR
jgi:hypothetical protein